MDKKEFLSFLHDPDICQEIFQIVKRGGKTLAEETKQSEPEKSQTSPTELEKINALREKIRKTAQERAAVREKIAPQKESAPTPEEKPKETKNLSFDEKLNLLRKKINIEVEKKSAAQNKSVVEEEQHEKYTIVLERKCPICEEQTRVIKCKQRIPVETKDMDFCIHYKNFNPYLYTIWACEHCGFAAEERKFLGHIPSKVRETLKEFLSANDFSIEFNEERTVDEAINFFKMAILFSELTDSSPGRQAGLYLTMAWIYRYEGEKDLEIENLKKAAELYEISLEKERWPIGSMSDDTGIYLTGVLYFILGDYNKATQFIGRNINNQNLRSTSPKIFEATRNLWQDIKQIKKAAEEEEKKMQSLIERAQGI